MTHSRKRSSTNYSRVLIRETCLHLKEFSYTFRLGFLDPTSDQADLRKGTQLELPLWLAKNLYNMYSVDIQLPKAFSHFYVNIMRADSSCVDLKRLQPNYYKVYYIPY